MDAPVTGTQPVEFRPVIAGSESPNRYWLAPLSWRERIAYTAELTREAGFLPDVATVHAALRSAVRGSGAANADEVLEAIDLAEANPEDKDAQVRLDALKAKLATAPAFAAIVAQRQQHFETRPWIAARHALRGWEGPGLPAFRQEGGLVPLDLLELIPLAELYPVGARAHELAWTGPSAEGNSASPSPSPETPVPADAS